jgi:hypothetical protein
MVEVLPDFGPFEARTEEKWYSMKTIRLAMLLEKIGSAEIDEVVDKASILLDQLEIESLSAQDRMGLGQALVLRDDYENGYFVLADIAKEVSTSNEGFGKWIWWHAGWAALMMNDETKANEAFNIVLTDSGGNPVPQDNWEYSEWLAGWFLGKVTDNDLVKYCERERGGKEDDPYFLIGERKMKEGKLDEARQSYELCMKASALAKDTWPANWARWRLKQIEARHKAKPGEK